MGLADNDGLKRLGFLNRKSHQKGQVEEKVREKQSTRREKK
jgi:hypothetical protein